jgi:hypothetical protein
LFTRYASSGVLQASDCVIVWKITHTELLERKGLYQSKLIQKVVNTMWFRNKQDEGITYSSYFNPFTIPALALVLTAVSRSDAYHSSFICLLLHLDGRLNAASTSGSLGSKLISPSPLRSTKMYMKTMFVEVVSLVA